MCVIFFTTLAVLTMPQIRVGSKLYTKTIIHAYGLFCGGQIKREPEWARRPFHLHRIGDNKKAMNENEDLHLVFTVCLFVRVCVCAFVCLCVFVYCVGCSYSMLFHTVESVRIRMLNGISNSLCRTMRLQNSGKYEHCRDGRETCTVCFIVNYIRVWKEDARR